MNFQQASRKSRATTENMVLANASISNSGVPTYIVKGTSNKNYQVEISPKVSCTCPDFMGRQQKCKHIYFVLIKVLKVDPDSSKYVVASNNNVVAANNNNVVASNNLVAAANNVTNKQHLIFENLLMNSVHNINIINGDVLESIYDYIEKIYDKGTKEETQKIFQNNVSVNEIMKDNDFTGVYLVKINQQIYELHMKKINKVVKKGWIYNSYKDVATSEKIARFLVVNQY